MKSKISVLLCPAAVCVGLALNSFQVLAADLPQGPTHINGAVIEPSDGNSMTINQTQNVAKIDWDSFDVGANNSVHFNQSADQMIANRVTGSSVSQVNGSLTGNGTVILINPNGINVGETARIDTGGFAALAGEVTDDEFENWDGHGSLKVKQTDGQVFIEKGATLTSQNLALVGNKVTNNGKLIVTNQGSGLLAAEASPGEYTVTLDNGIDVVLDQRYSGHGTAITNNGEIIAVDANGNVGGTIKMMVKDFDANAYGHNIYNSGFISAGNLVTQGSYFENAGAIGTYQLTLNGDQFSNTGSVYTDKLVGSGGELDNHNDFTVKKEVAGAFGHVFNGGVMEMHGNLQARTVANAGEMNVFGGIAAKKYIENSGEIQARNITVSNGWLDNTGHIVAHTVTAPYISTDLGSITLVP